MKHKLVLKYSTQVPSPFWAYLFRVFHSWAPWTLGSCVYCPHHILPIRGPDHIKWDATCIYDPCYSGLYFISLLIVEHFQQYVVIRANVEFDISSSSCVSLLFLASWTICGSLVATKQVLPMPLLPILLLLPLFYFPTQHKEGISIHCLPMCIERVQPIVCCWRTSCNLNSWILKHSIVENTMGKSSYLS